jgi:hypothetical protein
MYEQLFWDGWGKEYGISSVGGFYRPSVVSWVEALSSWSILVNLDVSSFRNSRLSYHHVDTPNGIKGGWGDYDGFSYEIMLFY